MERSKKKSLFSPLFVSSFHFYIRFFVLVFVVLRCVPFLDISSYPFTNIVRSLPPRL